MKKTSIIAGLFKLLKPLWHIMSAAIVLGILGYFAAAAITVSGIALILSAMNMISLSWKTLTVIMIVSAILRGFLRYSEQKCGHYIAFRILAVIRDKVYGTLRKLAPAKLLGKAGGDLCEMVTGDIEQLEVFYAHTLSPVAIAAVVSVSAFLLILKLCPSAAVTAALAYVTVGFFIPVLTSRIGEKSGRASREKLADLNDYFLESLRGINVSIQLGTINKRRGDAEKKTKELLREQRTIKKHEGITSALTGAAVTIFTVLAFVIGMCFSGNFAASILSAAVLSATFGPVIALSNLSAVLTQTFASAERVLSLLNEEPDVKENKAGEKPNFEGLKAENVSFGYGKTKVLTDFNINVEKGKINGLMGESGCGKSTAMGLMMRFWDCDGGRVSVSDYDIRDINTAHLTSLEGFMTQTTDLFIGTVRENIRIGRLNASDREVEEACKKASVHEFIMSLPKGYDTEVTELGANLSSGERQRIGLARAFLHDSPLLLLDEPTANLDAMNEGIILKSIKEEKGKTVVISSHRKSTISICDYVLKLGKVR